MSDNRANNPFAAFDQTRPDEGAQFFIAADGQKYPILRPEQMSADQMIQFDTWEAERAEFQNKNLAKLPREERAKALRAGDQMLSEMIKMIVPGVPDEALAAVPMVRKGAMIQVWYEQYALPTVGKAGGSRITPLSSRTSRDSQGSTTKRRRSS